MSIIFRCECGRELIAPDDYAGREVKCGLCGAIRTVPLASEPAPDYPSGVQPPPSGMGMPPFGVPPGAPPGAGASPPGYGPAWRQRQAGSAHQAPYRPPPSYGPMPPPYQPPPYGVGYQYQPPQVGPRFIPRPEQAGRAAAIASLVFGTIGIGGHALGGGCCLMMCGWIIAMFGCSLTAFIVGWFAMSAAATPEVRANARLGRALGMIGLIAGIIFIIFVQVPLLQQLAAMQDLG